MRRWQSHSLATFIDQVLDFEVAERLAFAKFFQLGDRLAELPRTGGLHGHQPSDRGAVTGDCDLLAGRHPVKETGQVCFGLESADGVHARIKLDRSEEHTSELQSR